MPKDSLALAHAREPMHITEVEDMAKSSVSRGAGAELGPSPESALLFQRLSTFCPFDGWVKECMIVGLSKMSGEHKWIIRALPRPAAKFRLFCFPYAGVGPSAFRGWADSADRNIEVCLVQLPGRENRLREPPFASMDELVPPLFEALCGQLDRPYMLYGHSLGGRVAFEVARAFRRAGLNQPLHLFVGASPGPQIPWLHPPMRNLEEDGFLREIQRRYGGMPSQIINDPELRALVVPALRADVTIMETYAYQPEPPFGFGITAFAGKRDPVVKPATVEEWRQQTSTFFRYHGIDADHFFTQSARPRLLETIGAIAAELAGAVHLPGVDHLADDLSFRPAEPGDCL